MQTLTTFPAPRTAKDIQAACISEAIHDTIRQLGKARTNGRKRALKLRLETQRAEWREVVSR